ncbi:hypothetical protein ACEPPN_000696 [Leptodophora sp. 'Broadleaf-Isolate-01']
MEGMTCGAAYKRRSPSAIIYLQHLAILKSMRPPQESSQPPSKRRKLDYPKGSQPPAAFWDNLSKIWLTERALKELDRRNSQPAPSAHHSLYRQSRRPVTRSTVAEWTNKGENWEPTQPAANSHARHSAEHLVDIKLLARNGGLDLSDLRGVRSEAKFDSFFEYKTFYEYHHYWNTRPYDRDFQQNLVDGGVYPDEYKYPDSSIPPEPTNLEEIIQRLAQPRPSLSPSKFSDDKFRKFKLADTHASKEKQVMESVIPIIEGEIKDAKCISGGIPFTNLNHLTDGTLVPGNPDRYYGARPEHSAGMSAQSSAATSSLRRNTIFLLRRTSS